MTSSITTYLFHRYTLYFLLWSLGYSYFIHLQFGAVYFVVTLIIAIFLNLDSSSSDPKNPRKKGLSAYSVFNPQFESIQGSTTAQQLESQITHRTSSVRPDEDNNYKVKSYKSHNIPHHYERASKNANRPCICGSGRKYKVCCSKLTAPTKQQLEEMAKWEHEWT